MRFDRKYLVVYLLWLVLLGAIVEGLWSGNLNLAIIAFLTLGLMATPFVSQRLLSIKLPSSFITAITIFFFATLFLGEACGFYERFWFWDVLLHAGSAIGLGLVGTVLILYLIRADKLRTAPVTAAIFAFCFAVTFGVFWEIFEFGIDWFFHLNMQKSGLVDTMVDLMVNCVGAAIGGAAGSLYLKGKQAGGFAALIAEFIQHNRRLFGPTR